jgi:hypothetical protein
MTQSLAGNEGQNWYYPVNKPRKEIGLMDKGWDWLMSWFQDKPNVQEMREGALEAIRSPEFQREMARFQNPYGGDDDDPSVIPFLGKGIVEGHDGDTEEGIGTGGPGGGAATSLGYKPGDYKKLKNQIAYWRGKDDKMNLAPLLALTDSWTGSNLLRGYEKPMTKEERMGVVERLSSKLEDRTEKDKYKAAYLKYLDAQRRGAEAHRSQQMKIKEALKKYDAEVKAQKEDRKYRKELLKHPATKALAEKRVVEAGVRYDDPGFKSKVRAELPYAASNLYEKTMQWQEEGRSGDPLTEAFNGLMTQSSNAGVTQGMGF